MNLMKVGGIIDISTKDIPHRSSMVIFTVGCNFQCEFCHNKYLLHPNVGREMSVEKLIEQVKNNQLVNGVSITGGEPTLQKELLELCQALSRVGKYISIDTNGSHPEIINSLLPFINRVALDLKGPLKKKILEKITKINIEPTVIIETFKLINNQENIDFEIRTTYVENILTPDDIHEIISFLIRNKFRGTFVLQQYQYSNGVGEKYEDKFKKPEHLSLLNILKPYKDKKFCFKIFLRDDVVGYSQIDKIFDITLDEINEI